jgi:hypothetical protein
VLKHARFGQDLAEMTGSLQERRSGSVGNPHPEIRCGKFLIINEDHIVAKSSELL